MKKILLAALFVGCSTETTGPDLPPSPVPSTITIEGQICWGEEARNRGTRELFCSEQSGRSYEDLYNTVKENPGSFCTTMIGTRVDCLRVPVYANDVRVLTDSIGWFSVVVSAGIDSIEFSMDEDELPMRFFAWEGARSNCVYEKERGECGRRSAVYTYLNYIVEDITVAVKSDTTVILYGKFQKTAMFRTTPYEKILYLFDYCLGFSKRCDREHEKKAPWSSVYLIEFNGIREIELGWVNWLTFNEDWNHEVIFRSGEKVEGKVSRRGIVEEWLWDTTLDNTAFVVYDNPSKCFNATVEQAVYISFWPTSDIYHTTKKPNIGNPGVNCNSKLTQWKLDR